MLDEAIPNKEMALGEGCQWMLGIMLQKELQLFYIGGLRS